jgi:hypothetical protein
MDGEEQHKQRERRRHVTTSFLDGSFSIFCGIEKVMMHPGDRTKCV